MTRRAIMWPIAVLAVVATVSCSEPAPKGSASGASTTVVPGSCNTDDLIACARKSTLAKWVPDTPTKATGTPITLGMVNQENTPAASFPELSQADEAAVAFVNDQLGGVDGHPIKLDVCNTKFTAEGSTTCGQRFVDEKVPAVLGGIDVFGNSIDILDQNGIPFVGGVPVSNQSATNANSFQFSGGTWGAAVAFAWYATNTLHAKRVSIVYGEYGSITQSAQFGEKVLKDHNVQVQMVPYPILATDISSALQAVAPTKPDAVMVLAADSGCKAGYDGIQALGLQAQAFYVGACASPNIIASVPKSETEGTIFNVEGPIIRTAADPDTALYSAVAAKYGKGYDPIGAGTVTFRSFMNLYAVMRELGADGSTPKAIMSAFRAKVDAPSFMGHPYTCNGKQLADLTAMCSPQQILAEQKNGQLEQLGTWIDVGKIYAGS